MEIVKPTLKVDLDIELPEVLPVKHNLGIIEEYAKQLNEFYGKLVFTNDQYTEAKDERAKVNKLKKTIEDNRKEIVKEFKQPIDDFEATSKRIEKLLESASNTIGASIEKFDLEQQEIKTQKINTLIEAIRQDYILNNPEFTSQLKQVVIDFDKRWFNKTYKDSDLENAIDGQFNTALDDLYKFKADAEMIITFFNTINVDNLLNKEIYIERYKFTRDVNEVINNIKADYEAKKVALQPQINKVELIDPFAGVSINNPTEMKPEREIIVMIICKESQLDLIKNFANQNGMRMED
jgi:hypothetical protein